jgi:phosphoglycerate kinase
MSVLSIEDLEVEGRRVICRVDFNVTRDKKTGKVTDDTRVVKVLPTIKALTENGARLVLCSHFGRPKGVRDESLSLRPVADVLAGHLEKHVAFAGDCVGEVANQASLALKNGDVLLLENLRFHSGEESDDGAFARKLADLGDIYVNDAFGTAHRAHASVHALPRLMATRAAGLLMQKELNYLSKALKSPEHPFVGILGGAKVSDKIGVIRNLLPVCDVILLGGAMAYTFLLAQGMQTGTSLVEPDRMSTALGLLEEARGLNRRLVLPEDHVVACKAEEGVECAVVPAESIPSDKMGLDIGPETVKRYAAEIGKAKLIIWNGPLGVFEVEPFGQGTVGIAEAVAQSSAISIVGGGESVAAVNKAGVADRITHISTGGGASLEFLEGKELPGVAALES